MKFIIGEVAAVMTVNAAGPAREQAQSLYLAGPQLTARVGRCVV